VVQERDGANNLKAQLVRDGNIGGFWSRERITALMWVLIGKDGRIQWIDKQITRTLTAPMCWRASNVGTESRFYTAVLR